MALANEILVDNNELDAYLIISAVSTLHIKVLPSIGSCSSNNIFLAFSLSVPITTLSGCKVSFKAVPSRKNSGQDAISNNAVDFLVWTMIFPTFLLVPGGTVLFVTITVYLSIFSAIDLAAANTAVKSASPFFLAGVPTAINTTFALLTASL